VNFSTFAITLLEEKSTKKRIHSTLTERISQIAAQSAGPSV